MTISIRKKHYLQRVAATAIIFLNTSAVCFAAASAVPAAPAQTDPNASNMSGKYKLFAQSIPALPVPPKSLSDIAAFKKYIAAVNAYLDAAQKYIDASTNDLNVIIIQRNLAIKSANSVTNTYNAFLDANKTK
ncbi:hypothetical protein [Pectinatus sottacetonis]|uniref:hypothetical protein n=1 Tax=Pectinatus sottacetonis TaxID=1002795 RepID=UPI0018C75627|nr:hypothetical protein [Pectinatus sottacetonis]